MSLKHLETIEIQAEDDIISISGFDGELQTGQHKNCRGSINIDLIGSYKVICCYKCFLRIKFPSRIIKQKQLRDYFENKSYDKPNRFDLLNIEEEK